MEKPNKHKLSASRSYKACNMEPFKPNIIRLPSYLLHRSKLKNMETSFIYTERNNKKNYYFEERNFEQSWETNGFRPLFKNIYAMNVTFFSPTQIFDELSTKIHI